MVSRCYLGTSRSVIQHLIMKSRKSKFPLISVRGKGRFLSISLAGSHVRHLLNLPASWEHLFALAARKQLLLFDPPGVSIPGFCRRHLGYLILTRSHCLYSFHFFISLCYVYLHKKPHILWQNRIELVKYNVKVQAAWSYWPSLVKLVKLFLDNLLLELWLCFARELLYIFK